MVRLFDDKRRQPRLITWNENEIGALPPVQKVGCDRVLSSKVVPDVCGVCNGDNSTCKVYKGQYTKQHYANREFPASPRGLLLSFPHNSIPIAAVISQDPVSECSVVLPFAHFPSSTPKYFTLHKVLRGILQLPSPNT